MNANHYNNTLQSLQNTLDFFYYNWQNCNNDVEMDVLARNITEIHKAILQFKEENKKVYLSDTALNRIIIDIKGK